ncbi:DUF1573 domain-containing protein [Ferruginibacter sp.]|uniref:DUF1573 domain-containing protein n=1 Tax=Ferruginibacter sp. TaxID=1940288 RepID=UPI0019BA53E7|nr:DUF1573 domain-containing protein [Ferruginibacter sp.]MBC7626230.1 DUF1573 domain-containing protein [Ferruginibacter sp.]
MKRFLLSAAVLAITSTVLSQPQAKKVADVAKFTNETIDFGKIKQSIPAKGTFTVTNISNAPLIIEQANPTCGCTISDYTKEPIAPGKTGVINATYNAANAGHFEKHLTVKFAGVDEMKSITFTGDVLTAVEFDKLKAAAAVVDAKPVAAPAATVKTVKKEKVKSTIK